MQYLQGRGAKQQTKHVEVLADWLSDVGSIPTVSTVTKMTIRFSDVFMRNGFLFRSVDKRVYNHYFPLFFFQMIIEHDSDL